MITKCPIHCFLGNLQSCATIAMTQWLVQHLHPPPVRSLVLIYTSSLFLHQPRATTSLLSFSINLNCGCFKMQYFSAAVFSFVQLEIRQEAVGVMENTRPRNPVGTCSNGTVTGYVGLQVPLLGAWFPLR